MVRKIVVPLALTALLCLAYTPAASAKSLKLSGTAWAGFAKVSAAEIVAGGPVQDATLGAGALVFTEATNAVPYTLFFAKGTLSGRVNFTVAAGPNGTTLLTHGTQTVTRGTGAYRHATGKGTISGSSDPKLLFTLKYRLKITLPN